MLQDSVLRLIERLLNRQLERSETARARAADLEGASLALHMTDLDSRICLQVLDSRLLVSGEPRAEPDAELAGSVAALVGLFGAEPEAGMRSGRIAVRGDGQTLARFRRLLQAARPDWEEELAGVLGDVPAHQIARLAGGLAEWGRRSAATLWTDLGEYLQEESRELPTRVEADEFMNAVDRLRSDVARLEARIARLAIPQATSGSPRDESRRDR